MALANLTAAPGVERKKESSIPPTIADAIDDSNRQFTFCYLSKTIENMTKNTDPRVEILRELVERAGGPAEFSRKHSRQDADKAIDATYVSQIINGHRAFGDKARLNMARRAGFPDNFFESNQLQQPVARQDQASYQFENETIKKVTEIMRRLAPGDQLEILGAAKTIEFQASKREPIPRRRAGQ